MPIAISTATPLPIIQEVTKQRLLNNTMMNQLEDDEVDVEETYASFTDGIPFRFDMISRTVTNDYRSLDYHQRFQLCIMVYALVGRSLRFRVLSPIFIIPFHSFHIQYKNLMD